MGTAAAAYAIRPSPGSKNPFAVPDASTNPAQKRYEATMRAGIAAGTSGSTFAATANSASSGSGFLVLRVYVPAQASVPSGEVPLPALSIQRRGGSRNSLPTCPGPDRGKVPRARWSES
ncbi:hypothetical protein [Streptomyces brasiliensis]|uniref:Uncharacterized protein n=1 Tax=Streptomyces brasiliensis TaxID=1954 RepID=A0A917K081_9ACTN|nr:hypothetical protein [Streptomyces brasiliensis]GGI94204.1 hypothetical protein GCM10010121_000690 [Streptomyces brasiliensis]